MHIYPIVPIAPIVRTADGEADCDCECYRLFTEMPFLWRGWEGRPIYKGKLPHSVQAWDDYWSEVIELQPGLIKTDTLPSLNSTAWVVGLFQRGSRKGAWSLQRQIPHGTLNSTA